MLPKTSAYVKSYDGQTKWMCFLIVHDDLLKNVKLFGIKSALISKKNLILSLPTNRIFNKQNKSHGNDVTDFYNKEIPKVDSIHAPSSNQLRLCSQER